jgi:hypothetical protein
MIDALGRSDSGPRDLGGGERRDQAAIAVVGGGTGAGPGQCRDFAPGALGREAPVTDQVGRVHEARPVMAGDAMEEDRLAARVGHEVGRLGHLLERRPRPAHRHDHPRDPRVADHPRLADVLGIVAIDRRQGDDRPDLLPGDDPAQGPGPLPRPPQQPTRRHDGHALLDRLVPGRRRAEAQRRRPSQHQPDRAATIQPHCCLSRWDNPDDDRRRFPPPHRSRGCVADSSGRDLPGNPNPTPTRRVGPLRPDRRGPINGRWPAREPRGR